MKCNKCGYEWQTKSKLIFISCPSCLQKVKNEKEVDKDGRAD